MCGNNLGLRSFENHVAKPFDCLFLQHNVAYPIERRIVMLVFFDNVIAYNSQLALLYNVSQPEKKVTLYSRTNKCLVLLIEGYPDIISQNNFFENVWENDGLEITANTFYQHIAMLRRAFEEVGFDREVIITIPRRGVSISSEISLIFNASSEKEVTLSKPSTSNPAWAKAINIFRKKSRYRLEIITFLSLLTFLVTFFITIWLLNSNVDKNTILSQYQGIGDIGKCEIFTFTSNTMLNDVKVNIIKNNINCNYPKKIYYSTLPFLNRTSLIACKKNHKESDACISYFMADLR